MTLNINYRTTNPRKVDKLLETSSDLLQDSFSGKSKILNLAIRNYVYSFLTNTPKWNDAEENSKTQVYFDSSYVGSDSDGSIEKPYNTLLFRDLNQDNTVFNLKRGSVFFIASERESVTYVTGRNCSIRAYGDKSLNFPVVLAARKLPGAEFGAEGSEFSRTTARSLSHTFDYVAYSDDIFNPLVRGTAVGALTSGQYIVSGGKVYVKDAPAGRDVIVSFARRVFGVSAEGFKIREVWWGGSSNHGLSVSYDDVLAASKPPLMMDTRSLFCGNNGIEIGENAKACRYATMIRHFDVGSRNNGINGSGDDGGANVIECGVYGLVRAAGDTYGYQNDGITAHGTEGLLGWNVLACTTFNTKEDGIDIIGQSGGGVLHADSVIRFCRVRKCGESGVFAWGARPDVSCNEISDTQWAPVQMGATTASNVVIDGKADSNLLYDGGKAANSAGVNLGGKGCKVYRNTIIRKAASVRACMQFANIAVLESGEVKGNLFIVENDAAIINTNTSSGATIKTLNWENNHYVIPSGNVVVPFATGGSPKTFAQWRTDVESTATTSATLAAIDVDAGYQPMVGSLLDLKGPGVDGMDFNGLIRSGTIGCKVSKIGN